MVPVVELETRFPIPAGNHMIFEVSWLEVDYYHRGKDFGAAKALRA
jgi:hypothetical protein